MPRPSCGISGMAMPTNPPMTQASWSVVSERAKALAWMRLGHVALDRRVERQLGQRLREPGRQAERDQRQQAVEQRRDQRDDGVGEQGEHHGQRRVDALEQRPDGDAEGVAEAGRADHEPEQDLGLPVADRVVAQQERHEHGEEAREPPRSAVGAQREGHRRRGCGSSAAGRCARSAGGREPAQHQRRPRRWLESTFCGSRIAQIGGEHEDHEAVAQRPLRARRSRRGWRAAPTAPAPTTPASETRALALTRVRSGGQQPGDGGGARDAVRLGRHQAAQRGGEQPARLGDHGRGEHPAEEARIAMVAPTAHRRPWLKRSRNGPISGATIAKGSIVRPRNSATWPRASPVGTWKNRVPASEIATAASPAALKACSSISRDRPESPAPSARAARRACATANCPARPRAAAGRRGLRGRPRRDSAAPARRAGPRRRASAPDRVRVRCRRLRLRPAAGRGGRSHVHHLGLRLPAPRRTRVWSCRSPTGQDHQPFAMMRR